MSLQSLRKALVLICALGVLTAGMTPALAAPDQALPAAQQVPTLSAGTTKLGREVFGFALGSSLSDPTVGYPSWNFNLLSTVAYFGLHVLWNGTFQNDSDLSVWNSSQLTDLVTTAHAHGTKVVVTIVASDNTGTYPNAMCDALLHTATTVKNTVAEVKAKGVDGVNVDYEGLQPGVQHIGSFLGAARPYQLHGGPSSWAGKLVLPFDRHLCQLRRRPAWLL